MDSSDFQPWADRIILQRRAPGTPPAKSCTRSFLVPKDARSRLPSLSLLVNSSNLLQAATIACFGSLRTRWFVMIFTRKLWATVVLLGITRAQYVNTTETSSPTVLGADRKTTPTTSKPGQCQASTVTVQASYNECYPTTVTCYVTVTPPAYAYSCR